MNIFDYDQVAYIYRDTPRPVLSGLTGESSPRTVVEISIGSKQYKADFNPVDGRFTWTPAEDMKEGLYNIAIVVIDAAGNKSPPTLRTLVIDTTPPEAPELLSLKDDVGAEVGSFDPGEITDDAKPTLTGVAQPNTVVYLRDDSGKNIGSAKADAVTGKWVIEPNDDLPPGDNAYTLTAIEEFGKDAKGNPLYREGKTSEAFIINVGEKDFITIDEAFDDAGKWSGVLQDGALTDDTTPTLRGQVNEGMPVIIYYRMVGESMWAGSATATVDDNNWTWTPPAAFTSGQYEFQAATPNISSALFKLGIIATESSDQLTVITQVWDDAGQRIGKLISGDYTDDMTPAFTGRAEANSRIVIQWAQNGSVNSATVDVGQDGRWSWKPSAGLSEGEWQFQVKSEGAAEWNDSFELHIYPSSSTATTITQVLDDVLDSGPINHNGTTDDNTPTLSGHSEKNAIVEIYDGKQKLGTAKADANGEWRFVTGELKDGSHDFWAIQQGYSDPSDRWKIEIDTSELNIGTPTITGLYVHENGLGEMLCANGSYVTHSNVMVTGLGHSGATIDIYDGKKLIGSTQVKTDGTWSFSHAKPYSYGSHSITAKEHRGGNKVSDASSSADFILVGDGVGGDSRFVFTSSGSDAFTGDKILSPGSKLVGQAGGHLTLLEGNLGMRDNGFNKEQPGNLKTFGDKGEISFKTDPTTDFYMAIGAMTEGDAKLKFYDIKGEYIGESQFDNRIAPTLDKLRNAVFTAPAGKLIGKVVLSWNDPGGVYIHNVNYGHSASSISGGVETFTQDITGYGVTGTHTQKGFFILDGYAKFEPGRLKLLDMEEFTFTVGRTSDISFNLDTPQVLEVTYYDCFGKVLFSDFVKGDISYTAPTGQFIGKIIIDTKDHPDVYIDDVIWGTKIADIDYGYITNNVEHIQYDDSAVALNGLFESTAIIDLHDGEANTKMISLEDILTQGEIGLFTDENTRQLMIQGDGNDVVQLEDIMPLGSNIEQWTQQQGKVTVAGVEYQVYNHAGDDAQLLVQSDIKVEII